MEAVDVRGRFVWHQLMTRDVPGAKKFYSKLMGWDAQAWPLDPSYTVCKSAGVPVAGVMAIPADFPAEAPSHWLQYIGTRDVDGTSEAAVRGGGSVVVAPGDMPGAGRYAVLKDPQGAMFAIIDPENARPEYPGMPPVGSFCWHELATSDYEAAFAFYSQLFGWDAISRMDMGPAGNYLIFGQNGVQRGGMYIKPPDWPAPPNWMPYGHVANVDESATHLDAAGAKILNAPMDVPGGGRITSLIDPSGAAFAINSVTAAAKPAAKSKSKSKANPMTNPESNPELNAELNPELKVEPKPEPKPEPKLESKPVVEVKAKAKAKAKTKAKPRVVKKKAASAKTSAAKTVRKTVRKAKAVARKKGKSLARKGKSLTRKGKRVARKEGRSLVRKGKSVARNFMKKAKKQVNAARSRMARRKK